MTTHRLAVVPAAVTMEAVELEDGTALAVEVAHPRRRYAVVHQDARGTEILSMHDEEAEAVAAYEKLAGQLEQLAGAPAGAVLQ